MEPPTGRRTPKFSMTRTSYPAATRALISSLCSLPFGLASMSRLGSPFHSPVVAHLVLVRLMKRLLLVFMFVASLCFAADSDDAKLWTVPQPLAFDGLRAWYATGGLPGQRWPRERKLNLNGDGEAEIFLGLEDYSRGMGYALFTHRHEGWVLICERVEGALRPFELLPESHSGWHDFLTVLQTWRGRGLLEITYAGGGHRYVRKSDRELKSNEVSNL